MSNLIPRLVFDEDDPQEANDSPETQRAQDEAQVGQAIEQAQRMLITHPIAAQAIFRAFVAEGRRHAQTPQGAALKAQIEDSELVRRGRVVWEGVTFNMLEEAQHATTFLPSALLDALVAATAHVDVDQLLERHANPWNRHHDPTKADPSSR